MMVDDNDMANVYGLTILGNLKPDADNAHNSHNRRIYIYILYIYIHTYIYMTVCVSA